jgi:predicted metalloprotease with PDZ domain
MSKRLRVVGAVFIAASALVCAGAEAARLDPPLATPSNPMTVILDETLAPRGIAYAHVTVPVKPGPFTLVYPEWIPGEHGPTGPLNDVAELKISANGTPLAWSRDQVDMYSFHVNVPEGVSRLNADFTVLLNGDDGVYATRNIMVGNWNRYLLYQPAIDNKRYFVKASLILPPGWSYASSLPVAAEAGRRTDFRMVSLETLVDSPTDSGRFFKRYITWTGGGTHSYMDLFADRPEDLAIPPKLLAAYDRMTAELIALYGGRHWNVYNSELTLSDAIGNQGIEHHQSSDDRASDDFLTNPLQQLDGGDLLTHEFSHSWNGKYRRPFDLEQPNFNEPYPEHTELLWQYEGMNQYMGDLVAFRAGIKGTSKDYPEYFAAIYEQMADEAGRDTTPIVDVTMGAPYYYVAHGTYVQLRRSSDDFYTEGELMWLDADTIIRQRTGGKKSLDDYVKLFAGGVSGPRVVTYTRADIERYLNQVTPYDWHGFFERYVYSIATRPPTDEIARAGYKYVVTDRPNRYVSASESTDHVIFSWMDAGLLLDNEGKVNQVREGSPAWKAGVGVGMTIYAVNGRTFSHKVWNDTLKASDSSTSAIALLVKQGQYFQTIALGYHGGLKYPHLVRLPGTVDMLSSIMAPHANAR